MENVSFKTYCRDRGISGFKKEQFWRYIVLDKKNQLADENFPAKTCEQYDREYEEFNAAVLEWTVTEAAFENVEIMSQKQIEAVLEEIC